MKVVLLGGSFNPIHDGHKDIMLSAIKAVQADQGWFLLANNPPLKDDVMLDYDIRHRFIDYMIKGYKNLKVCDIEKTMEQPNYTIHTLLKLKKQNPMIQFYFLIGSDQAQQFEAWYRYSDILKEVIILQYPRSGFEYKPMDNTINLNFKEVDISSTEIRKNTKFATHPRILNEMALYGYYGLERLKTHLKKERLEHSLRVSELSVELAEALNLDVQLAYGIGIAHDLLKQMDNQEIKQYLKPFELQQPRPLWHAYASVRFHSRKMYVKDQRFLDAIYHHTLGHSSKSYSQILFIADKCEPSRRFKERDSIIELAKYDLRKAFDMCKLVSKEFYERKKNESN